MRFQSSYLFFICFYYLIKLACPTLIPTLLKKNNLINKSCREIASFVLLLNIITSSLLPLNNNNHNRLYLRSSIRSFSKKLYAMLIYLDISITTKDLFYQSTNLSISEPQGFSLTFIKSSCRETWTAGLSRMSTSFGTLLIRPLGDEEKSIFSK